MWRFIYGDGLVKKKVMKFIVQSIILFRKFVVKLMKNLEAIRLYRINIWQNYETVLDIQLSNSLFYQFRNNPKEQKMIKRHLYIFYNIY